VEFAGMNVQVAANLDGRIAAIGPLAVHGARHDAHAFEASGLKVKLASTETAARFALRSAELANDRPLEPFYTFVRRHRRNR
jgi:hypothetical protein